MRTRREFTSSTWSDTSILMSSSMVPHFTSLNLAGVSQRLVSHTPTLSCCLEYSLQLMPSAEASAAVLEAQSLAHLEHSLRHAAALSTAFCSCCLQHSLQLPVSYVTESLVLMTTCVALGFIHESRLCFLTDVRIRRQMRNCSLLPNGSWLAERATVGACCEYRRDTIIVIMGVHQSAGVYLQPINK